jgi:hypothetical protein
VKEIIFPKPHSRRRRRNLFFPKDRLRRYSEQWKTPLAAGFGSGEPFLLSKYLLISLGLCKTKLPGFFAYVTPLFIFIQNKEKTDEEKTAIFFDTLFGFRSF